LYIIENQKISQVCNSKNIKKNEFIRKNFSYSRGKCLSSAAEQFFSGKNLAVYFVNPQIFPMACAKNSQMQLPVTFHSVSEVF
jgi:hypothetical protein